MLHRIRIPIRPIIQPVHEAMSVLPCPPAEAVHPTADLQVTAAEAVHDLQALHIQEVVVRVEAVPVADPEVRVVEVAPAEEEVAVETEDNISAFRFHPKLLALMTLIQRL